MKSLLASIFILLTLAACVAPQTTPTPGPFTLTNTSWTLTSITHNGVTQTPPPGIAPITFDVAADGKVSGNSGCNLYSSTLVTQGEIFRLSSIQSTLRACADPKMMEFEGEYLARLYQGQIYEKRDNQLTITFADGAGRLLFTSN
jgi:heat shock protein HslJ